MDSLDTRCAEKHKERESVRDCDFVADNRLEALRQHASANCTKVSKSSVELDDRAKECEINKELQNHPYGSAYLSGVLSRERIEGRQTISRGSPH